MLFFVLKYLFLITCGAKLLNADWLRKRAFFLNHEGTFGNQEGMITWCWLAEHACIKLVSRLKRIEKEFQKRVACEFDLNTVVLTYSNVKENEHVTKRSLLVEKPKDFSGQKCIDSQPEKCLSGETRLQCRTNYRVTELHGRQTES